MALSWAQTPRAQRPALFSDGGGVGGLGWAWGVPSAAWGLGVGSGRGAQAIRLHLGRLLLPRSVQLLCLFPRLEVSAL